MIDIDLLERYAAEIATTLNHYNCGYVTVTNDSIIYSPTPYPLNNRYVPKIKRVIFNDPATIVYWEDGTKTVVKCGENDTFDKEKGLAMAIVKRMMKNKGNYNDIFRKWIKED
ncbi:MAG: hypothetical protein J5725_09490 [Bacteroidales bacterium]|nr:hypothetical protein [Bacteroidales bacterium]